MELGDLLAKYHGCQDDGSCRIHCGENRHHAEVSCLDTKEKQGISGRIEDSTAQRQQDAVLVIKNTFVAHNQISSWLTVAAKVATFVCPANQGHAADGTEHDGDVDEAVEYERVHAGAWRYLIHHDEEEANQNARN